MGVPRFTTPTITLTFTEQALDFTQADHVYVTFRSGYKELTLSDDNLSVSEKTISVRLTQAQTGTFGQGFVEVQVNWTIASNRFASEVATIDLSKQLLAEVVE